MYTNIKCTHAFDSLRPLAIIAHECLTVLSLLEPSFSFFYFHSFNCNWWTWEKLKIESFSVASLSRAINKQLRNRKRLWLIYLHFLPYGLLIDGIFPFFSQRRMSYGKESREWMWIIHILKFRIYSRVIWRNNMPLIQTQNWLYRFSISIRFLCRHCRSEIHFNF